MIVTDHIKRRSKSTNLGWLKEKNWEQSGLLEGLEGVALETVVKLFNEVDFVLLDTSAETEELVTYIFPVLRRIVTKITDKSMEKHGLVNSFGIHGVTEEELLPLINVKEITGLLYVYCRGFIPFAETFLPDLDAQAESVSLFCDNYIMKLIGRVKYPKNTIKGLNYGT